MSTPIEKTGEEEPSVPLVDEIEQLIAKEKLLSELRLVEARTEAKRWKELAQQASREPEADEVPEPPSPVPSKEDILASCAEVLDLSGIPLDEEDLKVILKLIFFRRKAASPIKAVLLKGCDLDSRALFFVSGVLGDACAVETLDLSHNRFANELVPCVTEALKLRRQPLQMILLHGNVGISSFPPKATDFVKYFGASTTGISVSFQDIPALMDSKPSNAPRMLSRFLSELVTSLESAGLDPAPKKGAIKTRSSTSVKLNANRGIQTLHFLGVTNVNTSRLAVGLLAKVLKLSTSTLLHLDLSFAFTSYVGARAISELLVSPGAQLTHVCLRGNLISDVSMGLLTSALCKNKTLVHLDVSSNMITYEGASKFITTITDSSCFNAVLQMVNWTYNHMNSSDLNSLSELTRECGALFRIKHDLGMTHSLIHRPPGEEVLLIIPGVVSKRTAGAAVLYSTDVARLPAIHSGNVISAYFSLKISVPQKCLVAGAVIGIYNNFGGTAKAVVLCKQDLDFMLLTSASSWVQLCMKLESIPLSGQLVLKVSFDVVNSTKYRDLANVSAKDFILVATTVSSETD